jgi:hypothetical protein
VERCGFPLGCYGVMPPARVEAVKRCLRCDSVFDASAWRCPACAYGPTERPFPRFIEDDEAARFPEWSFEVLAEHEVRSFWFRARHRIVLTGIRRHFPSPTNIFELGCGTGFVLCALVGAVPTR